MVAILRMGLYSQEKFLDSPLLILPQLLTLKLPVIDFVKLKKKKVKRCLNFKKSSSSEINGEVVFKFTY